MDSSSSTAEEPNPMPDNARTVSVPGSLMLFGEHAVLRGAPAVVTAVDQRMRVTCRLR